MARKRTKFGWIGALLAVVAASLALAPAGNATVPEPPDPEANVTYPISNGFMWWMPPRFGLDENKDAIVDYHYERSWVHATSFKVDFNGCTTAAERQAPTTSNRYRFMIDGAASAFANACKIERTLAEGPHTVVLDVQNSAGTSLGHFEQAITVKNRLIASIGDSYGSGEGNPDIPRKWSCTADGHCTVVSEAKWVDRRCHRSATAGPAQAAAELEFDDPHSTVTFFSLACSGATISTPDPDNPANGTGLLGPYVGAEPGPNPNPAMLPPQVDQLRDIVKAGTDYPERKIDDLIISIGGNDMQFVKLIMECTLSLDCYNDPNIAARLANRKGELPDRYDDLGFALQTVPIKPGHVFITEYPNLTLQDNGQFCGTNSTWWNEPLMLGVTSSEVRWMYEQLLVPMNRQIMPDRAAANGWTFVGGIMDAFGVVGQAGGHGYCANDTWLRRSSESVRMQGPDNPLQTKGLLHPNARGHEVYKQRILAALQGTADAEAPTYELTYKQNGKTAVIRNGWALGTCEDATGDCFSGFATPKVTVRDPDGIAYTNVYVNGVRGDGCTWGKSIDATTWEWYPCPSGWTPVSEIRLVATDKKGNTSTRTFEYRSDLTVPTASAKPARPPVVDGFYGAPVDVTLSGSELSQVVANSGVSYVRYRVDGGAWQQTANGSAVTIGTDGPHVIEYHAVDFAGRESGKATLANDYAPPPDVPLAVNLDLRPPVPSALATPAANAAGWTNDTTTVDLGASDGAGSGVKEIVYSAIGAQPIGATTVPFEFASVDITAPGTTTITYQARDRVGNLSTPKKVTVKLDKTPPAAALASPAEGTVYRSGTISMGGTASDGLSGLARVEFLVDGSVVSTDTVAPYSFAIDSATIPDGIRQIALRATDAAGNQSLSARTVYVNRTANTYLLSRPPHTTSSTAASFSFSAWNTAATYECSLDGSAFAACTSPKAYVNLALGQHTFRVRSKLAGVLDATPVVYTWLIEPPAPARTMLASVGPAAASEDPSASATGRFVAFQTTGALVPADTNNVADIYVRDRDTDKDGIFDEPGTTALARVSLANDGAQATGQSRAAAISADGRFVAFASDAANLVAGDTNARRDVFLRDRDIDGDGVFDEPGATSTIRVSVSSTGVQGDMNADDPAISADGRWIGFDSLSTVLAPGGNGYFQVYAFDRVSKQLIRVSTTAEGAAGAGHSSKPAFSANGRYVAYVSNALNLAGVPSEHFQNDVYVSDRDSDGDGVFDESGATKTVKMSYSLTGGGPNGYVAYRPAISSTGRFVAFESTASNLVADDGNGLEDVFVRDRDADRDGIFDEPRASTLARVSVSTAGLQANGTSAFPDGVAISGDGRYVAFASIAKNLAPEATSGYIQVYLRDRKTGRTSLGSVTVSGAQGSLRSDSPALSSNGGYLAFASDSINMTPDDGTSDLDLFTTKVDLVAPDTAITAGPRFFTAATTGTFTWTATKEGVTYTCSLDHAAYVPCSSPRLVNGLAPGEHVFQVRATDASGNTDPTAEAREWVVQ